MRILHLADREVWGQGQAVEEYRGSTRGRTLDEEGFVHAAAASQLPGVIERFYSDVDLTDYLLLVIDVPAVEATGAAVKWEGVAGAGEPFPHVYGSIPDSAIVGILTVSRANGALVLPDLSGLDVIPAPPPQ